MHSVSFDFGPGRLCFEGESVGDIGEDLPGPELLDVDAVDELAPSRFEFGGAGGRVGVGHGET